MRELKLVSPRTEEIEKHVLPKADFVRRWLRKKSEERSLSLAAPSAMSTPAARRINSFRGDNSSKQMEFNDRCAVHFRRLHFFLTAATLNFVRYRSASYIKR